MGLMHVIAVQELMEYESRGVDRPANRKDYQNMLDRIRLTSAAQPKTSVTASAA